MPRLLVVSFLFLWFKSVSSHCSFIFDMFAKSMKVSCANSFYSQKYVKINSPQEKEKQEGTEVFTKTEA